MSARRKRVISTQEIQLTISRQNVIDQKKKGVSQNGQTPSIIGICSYCVVDRPVFERCQTLLHLELTPWWSFLCADGAHHKKPHSPTHPHFHSRKCVWTCPLRNGCPGGDELRINSTSSSPDAPWTLEVGSADPRWQPAISALYPIIKCGVADMYLSWPHNILALRNYRKCKYTL